MELRQVRYFVAAVQAGGFGPAADELLVTRSALSKQIQLLERELGATLFERGGGRREVVLTEAGEAFLPAAHAILTAVDDGRQRVEATSGLTRGRIDVVVARGFVETWVGWADVLPMLRTEYPGYAVKIREGHTNDRMMDMVAEGTTDLAVMPVIRPPERPDLDIEIVWTERLLVAMSPLHRLAGRDEVAIEELVKENWLLLPVQRALVAEVGADLGPPHQVEFDAPTATIALQLVAANEGISLVNEVELPYWSDVETVPLSEPMSHYSVALVYRSGPQSSGLRIALDYIRGRFELI